MSITSVLPLPISAAELRPRLRQTLEHLMDGRSEKQIALLMCISHHTVHAYIKELYKIFGANSRAELLSRVFRSVMHESL